MCFENSNSNKEIVEKFWYQYLKGIDIDHSTEQLRIKKTHR